MYIIRVGTWVPRAVLRSRVPLRPQFRLHSSKSGPGSTPNPAPVPVPGAATTSTPPVKPVLPLWQRLGPLTRLGEAYSRNQRQRPYATQIASAIFIYVCADLSAQSIRGTEYESARTFRALVIGAVAAIPSYEWFLFLSRNFNYSSRFVSIGVKIIVNQMCLTPIFNTYFFGSQALLSGENLTGTVQRVRDTVPTSIANSWKFWPVVTALSFTFVPIEHRAVFSGFFAIGWQTYLSYLNRKAEIKEHAMIPEVKQELAPPTHQVA